MNDIERTTRHHRKARMEYEERKKQKRTKDDRKLNDN